MKQERPVRCHLLCHSVKLTQTCHSEHPLSYIAGPRSNSNPGHLGYKPCCCSLFEYDGEDAWEGSGLKNKNNSAKAPKDLRQKGQW